MEATFALPVRVCSSSSAIQPEPADFSIAIEFVPVGRILLQLRIKRFLLLLSFLSVFRGARHWETNDECSHHTLHPLVLARGGNPQCYVDATRRRARKVIAIVLTRTCSRSASFSIDPHFDRICSHKPEWIRALPWLERFGLLLDSPLTRNIVCALESAGLFLSKQASVI